MQSPSLQHELLELERRIEQVAIHNRLAIIDDL